MNGKNALFLIGSPRGKASVSNSLGDHLLALLKGRGLETEKMLIYPALADEKKMGELLAAVDSCGLLILAFPLYVDHLPAPVIDLLRRIAERRHGRHVATDQAIAAIVNCGFPETEHCRPAAEITRIFAKTAGFRFLGCLALGMGGAIGNRELAKAGGIARHQVKALAQAAAFLADNKGIPDATIDLMGKAMMPRWLYNLVADWGWKRAAKKHGSYRKLYDQPHAGA